MAVLNQLISAVTLLLKELCSQKKLMVGGAEAVADIVVFDKEEQ